MSVLTFRKPVMVVTLPGPPPPGLLGATGGRGGNSALQMARRIAVKVPSENNRPVQARQAVFAGSLLGTHGNLEMSCIKQLMPSALLMVALQGHSRVERSCPGHRLPGELLTSQVTPLLRSPRKTAAPSPPSRSRRSPGSGRPARRAAGATTSSVSNTGC